METPFSKGAADGNPRRHADARSHHLPAVGGADGGAAVVLPVDDGECAHLAAEADAEEHCEHVKHPGVVSEEKDDDGGALHEEAYGHGPFATHAVGDYRHAEPGNSADRRKSHEESSGRTLGNSFFLGYGYQEGHDDGVAGASPEVDSDEVPEGPGTLGLVHKHLGPYFGDLRLLHFLNGLILRGAHGPQADLRRLVVKWPYQQEHDHAPGNAGDPECRSQPALTSTESMDYEQNQGNEHQGPHSLGGL